MEVFSQYINALVLGILEGLTEFLPVSSTGHLIIASQFFSFNNKEFENLFNILIQSGAIFAVILHFRKKIFPFYPSMSSLERKNIYVLWGKAVIGILPFVILGLLFLDTIEEKLMNPLVVAISLIVWGAGILIVERFNSRKNTGKTLQDVSQLSLPLVLGIGLFQCLALVPGTSRSAVTILGAMLLGSSRVLAAEFSFYLSIPTLLGAGAWSLLKAIRNGLSLNTQEILLLIIGTVSAFFVALLVIKAFMSFIQRKDFKPFGWYRIVLGLTVLAYFLIQGGLFTAKA